MAKIPKTVGELVEDALKAGKVVGKSAKVATPVLPKVTPKPSRYLAPQPTVRGQTHKSGYSGVVKAYRPEDVAVNRLIANPAVLDKKVVTPSDLQGGSLVGWMGDRAQAGTVIDSINGFQLAKPVRLQGGGDWMLDSAGSIMASDTGIANKYRKLMDEMAQEGNPVYSSHILMGEQGVDFNRMVSDLFSNTKGKVNAQTAKDMTKNIKSFAVPNKTTGKTVYPFADFVGINSPDFDKWLSNLSGAGRAQFIKLMDQAGMQNIQGIPDVGAIRIAVTDPALLEEPTMSTGFAIGRYNPEVGTINVPDIEHGTYNTQIAGSPVGAFGEMLPYETVFRDFSKMMDTQYPTSRADYIASRKPPVQKLDQEWVDTVSKALEDLKKLKELKK